MTNLQRLETSVTFNTLDVSFKFTRGVKKKKKHVDEDCLQSRLRIFLKNSGTVWEYEVISGIYSAFVISVRESQVDGIKLFV